ncbi:MAG: DNA polymerase III subunit chi [Gammaproteobacteria bacterium]|nr:DNA polymerase III subunit chi [Gammaproteobacteria bacterium]
MTRIDFYILNEPHENADAIMACRLAEKAFSLKHQVYIHTRSAEHTEKIDNLLWTFREGSFLPHQPFTSANILPGNMSAEHLQYPVLIGHTPELDTAMETQHQVLINLTEQIPMFFSRFERVTEIVPANESSRHQARERYRFYQDRGYELKTHNLSK